MAGLREFLDGPTGKYSAIGLVVVGVIVAFISFKGSMGSSELRDETELRMFVDKENPTKWFEKKMERGDTVPVKSPFSGKMTGVPAEKCWWTADGKIKDKPNGVLLNSNGPTFCPECGRLVVVYNPRPGKGDKPPPTKAEYEQTHKSTKDTKDTSGENRGERGD